MNGSVQHLLRISTPWEEACVYSSRGKGKIGQARCSPILTFPWVIILIVRKIYTRNLHEPLQHDSTGKITKRRQNENYIILRVRFFFFWAIFCNFFSILKDYITSCETILEAIHSITCRVESRKFGKKKCCILLNIFLD